MASVSARRTLTSLTGSPVHVKVQVFCSGKRGYVQIGILSQQCRYFFGRNYLRTVNVARLIALQDVFSSFTIIPLIAGILMLSAS